MVAIDTAGLTWRDLDVQFPDLRFRELHHGALVVTPSPAWWHQGAVGKVYGAALAWCAQRGGRVFVAPLDLVVGEHDVYQPDVFVVRPEHLDRLGDDGRLHAPPDLVVEVSSPSTRARDLGAKRSGYAAFGVPEYWFVDLDARAVVVHRLRDGRYLDPEVVVESEVVSATVLDGLHLGVADLVADAP